MEFTQTELERFKSFGMLPKKTSDYPRSDADVRIPNVAKKCFTVFTLLLLTLRVFSKGD